MRNASMVLGIIGGVICIPEGLFLIAAGVIFINPEIWQSIYNPGLTEAGRQFLPDSRLISFSATLFIIFGVLFFIAAALGLIGGIIVKKKNVASGVMMIVAAVLSLLAYFNVLSMILFLIGGILALMKEPQNVMPTDPPQSPRA
ncbi:MAG: DUF4064 domain-containing protein [Oscillospiraceae bacterium]|nr:DUF4064 domain-containing protein [Oscillospiraceae bacterium]